MLATCCLFWKETNFIFDEGSQRLDSETFLDRGLYPALESRMAKNLVRYLLRQGFDRFATSKGLKQYSLSNKRKLHWFPQGLVDGDKITFGLPSGGSSWKAVVGYKTIKAKEGTTRIRNWHFGIEAVPRIGFDRFISVLPHVVFSENGQLYESSRRQHSSRRRQCKSWYNNDWRDRILATLWHLSGGKDTISMQLGSEAFASFFAYPEEVSSPVSYARTLRTVIDTPENEDFENEQYEEEDPETVADE